VSASVAGKNPINLLFSGPTGASIYGQFISSLLKIPNLIVVDMGGTTFDVALIKNSEPIYTDERELEGYPVRNTMVEIHSIGSGGGSLAWIDRGGALRVGPESAGSDPGPACYGLSGLEPTVTDANLLLGYLPSSLIGGMGLDIQAAKQAITSKIAKPSNMNLCKASLGIYEVVNANMAEAIRTLTVYRGYDVRDFTLLAMGGAGPVHVCKLGEILNINRIIIPLHSGMASALGFLFADVRHEFSFTFIQEFKKLQLDEIDLGYRTIKEKALQLLKDEEINKFKIIRSADIRYKGQAYEINVNLEGDSLNSETFLKAADSFHKKHKILYGYSVPDEELELVNIKVTSIGFLERPHFKKQIKKNTKGEFNLLPSRKIYFTSEQPIDCPIVQRENLPFHFQAKGPIIIEEPGSTTVVPPGWNIQNDNYRFLIIKGGE
jgi:N-methylhydantoinase A